MIRFCEQVLGNRVGNRTPVAILLQPTTLAEGYLTCHTGGFLQLVFSHPNLFQTSWESQIAGPNSVIFLLWLMQDCDPINRRSTTKSPVLRSTC